MAASRLGPPRRTARRGATRRAKGSTMRGPGPMARAATTAEYCQTPVRNSTNLRTNAPKPAK